MKQQLISIPEPSEPSGSKKIKVVVLTTVMLTFITFWRASAIILSDLASSAYYVVGIAEKAVGPSAPWFILFVMLFAYAIRAVYIESSSMFVRGGVYRVVHEALGEKAAKFSVSALIFDYLITAPISAVSAGQYLSGLLNSLLHSIGSSISLDESLVSVATALTIQCYFWRKNIIGIEESSEKALRIFQVTATLAAVLFVWSIVTIAVRGAHLPPFTVQLSDDALGWLRDIPWLRTIGLVGVLVGMGHSILAVSGEETLAQVYRELEAPKLKNLKRTGLVIFLFAFVFTGVNALFASMIVPQAELLGEYNDNALSGLAMHFVGPHSVLLALQVFVVVTGFLILAGAVNTALIGANSVLNRVAEDGVLHDWFRKPHPKFGTSYRIVHTLAILQTLIIIASRGDVFLLGEAYAFGVVWSFIMKAYSMIVLRFKDRTPREWKVPPNITIAGIEIPLGLGIVFAVLFALGVVNLFTKPTATKGGIAFTILLYIVFGISEKLNKQRAAHRSHELEKFNMLAQDQLTAESLGCQHVKRTLVAVGVPGRLEHLQKCLKETDPETTDIIVMRARVVQRTESATASVSIDTEVEELFTAVIKMAEKEGKTVIPIVVPTNNVIYALAHTAAQLGSEEVIMGTPHRYPVDYLFEQFALHWGMVEADEKHNVRLRAVNTKKEFIVEL
ncbi:MAG TPA: APC family permease [Bacteroidota bacterium]|nr:APC family permease [Bacteroidota bacterium]